MFLCVLRKCVTNSFPLFSEMKGRAQESPGEIIRWNKEPQAEQNQLQNNKEKTWTPLWIPGGRFFAVGGAAKDRTECAWVPSPAHWNPVFKMHRWPHTKALECVFEVHIAEFWQINGFLSADNSMCGNLCSESHWLKRKWVKEVKGSREPLLTVSQ